MDSLTDLLSRMIAESKYVRECPFTSVARYNAHGKEHATRAVTISHSGIKPEGEEFSWYAGTAKLAVDEFARVLNDFTCKKAWGYRRPPEVVEAEGGFVCTARVFVFDRADRASEVEIIHDER